MKLFNFWENIIVLVRHLTLQYSESTFSGLLMDDGAEKGPLPRTCQTYPAMMKLGIVIPYLKEI